MRSYEKKRNAHPAEARREGPDKNTGSAYDSRYRHKLNMLEPGTVMLKWAGLLGLAGLVLLLLRLKAAACIALGLAGALLAVLFVLLAVEAHQDRVLNEIALQEEREREGRN